MNRSHQGAPGMFRGALEPPRGRIGVPQPPVVNEADVVQVLPALRNACESLFQQCDGQIGAAGAARRRFGEKYRPQPVRRGEPRIEGGRGVQQRVQTGVVVCPPPPASLVRP